MSSTARRVGHPGVVLFCAIFLVLVLGFWQWALANRQYLEWIQNNAATSAKLSPEQRRILWILIGSSIGWVGLYMLFVNAPAEKARRTGIAKLNFNVLVRRRLVEGNPIRPGVLRIYGSFGVLGFVLATALSLRLVHGYTWLRSMELFQRELDFGLPLLTFAMFGIAGHLVWSACGLSGWEPVDEAERRQIAAGILEEEREEAEAEREERRTSVDGWPYAVFLVFLGGALLLGSRLPDRQGPSAWTIAFTSFEFSALTLYVARIRPLGRWVWHVLVLGISAGGLIWGWGMAEKPGWFMAGAFVWGAAFGFLLVLVYLRKLNRNPMSVRSAAAIGRR